MNAREAALRALMDVEANGAYIGQAIDRAIRVAGAKGSQPADARDAALAREIALGVTRWKTALDDEIFARSSVKRSRVSLAILCTLRIGVYQIRKMARIPDRSACDECVKLAVKYGNPGSARYVNAMLRALARDAAQERVGPLARDGAITGGSAEARDGAITVGSAEARDGTITGGSAQARLDVQAQAQSQAQALPAEPAIAVNADVSAAPFPEWISRRWTARYGARFAEAMMAALSEKPMLSIRVNALRAAPADVARSLAAEGIPTQPGLFAPCALRLPKPSGFSKTAAFRDGLFSVQDEASMLCAPALGARPGDVAIDICAAPGGKATHIAEIAQDALRVIACDIYPRKLERVERNCSRLGLRSVSPAWADAEAGDAARSFLKLSLGRHYDCALLDAPCTGLGVLRRKPDVKWNRQEGDVERLAAVQSKMLDAAADAIKPGGVIVYCVCTTEPEEGEDQVTAFLGRRKDFRPDPIAPRLPLALRGSVGGGFREIAREPFWLRLYPHIHGVDGFFIARLKKAEAKA